MSTPAENLSTARQYLQAIGSGETGDKLTQFFAPEVIVEIFPSRFFPTAAATTWQAFAPQPSAAKR